jgi:hypothetical protein
MTTSSRIRLVLALALLLPALARGQAIITSSGQSVSDWTVTTRGSYVTTTSYVTILTSPAVAANAYMEWNCSLFAVAQDGASNNLRFTFNVPSSPRSIVAVEEASNAVDGGTSTFVTDQQIVDGGSMTPITTDASHYVYSSVIVRGALYTASTGGVVNLQVKRVNTNCTITVMRAECRWRVFTP